MLENVIHQIDSKSERLLLSASFTAKFALVFVLTLENNFILKPTERVQIPLKNGTRIFKIALRLIDWDAFMWQSVETLNVFNTLTLKQIFWKTKIFFKKLE